MGNTKIAKLIIAYYDSLYHGTILQTINIINLMTVPLLNYFIKKNNTNGIYYIVVSQIAQNIMYLIDLILMIMIYGI